MAEGYGPRPPGPPSGAAHLVQHVAEVVQAGERRILAAAASTPQASLSIFVTLPPASMPATSSGSSSPSGTRPGNDTRAAATHCAP